MTIVKLTESLCPICYKKIPAVVYEDNGIMMQKRCAQHGTFVSMVERDAPWYNLCTDKSIYDGYLIDVTSRCNIKCEYCYHNNKDFERSVDDINGAYDCIEKMQAKMGVNSSAVDTSLDYKLCNALM